MPVKPIRIPEAFPVLDEAIAGFIEDGEHLVDTYQEDLGEQVSPAFEPADYQDVAEVLAWLKEAHFPGGARFCEWGSGFGIVAGVAELLGFTATGIELDAVLIDQARALQKEAGLSYELIEGSFFDQPFSDRRFDLIYAFPWPGEVTKINAWFEQTAAPGTLLFTYHCFDDRRLVEKL